MIPGEMFITFVVIPGPRAARDPESRNKRRADGSGVRVRSLTLAPRNDEVAP
jgi:hypothetical protein